MMFFLTLCSSCEADVGSCYQSSAGCPSAPYSCSSEESGNSGGDVQVGDPSYSAIAGFILLTWLKLSLWNIFRIMVILSFNTLVSKDKRAHADTP